MTIDAELVERMCSAYNDGDDSEAQTKAMTAALRVAADALLEPVTPKEWRETSHGVEYSLDKTQINNLLAARRARLEAHAKTPEERVSIEDVPAGEDTLGGWAVHLDGKSRLAFASKSHAEIYRLGLIATLKEEGKRA